VGIGTNDPDDSAILDIQSASQGILIPRMSTEQRNAIPNPTSGLLDLLVYDNTVNTFYFFNGNEWKELMAAN